MQRFLRFSVEHALSGSTEAAKEYLIGVEVFDRPADYDPRLDPIVRVEARRLRAKLKSYYKSPGRHDPVFIDFPKGAYAPVFSSRSGAAPAAVTKPAQTSIAVLPFSNLSPESGEDYFSDGLTEELILLLTRIKGLRVVAWNSASKFRGRERELPSIQRELNAQVALLGSVRRAAGRIRVTAQLVDTASGDYLWSEGFDRGTHDVVAIQEEIARAIVETLRIALEPPKPPAAPARKLNLESYNLCLQARFHAHGRTSAGLQRSLECYKLAAEKDPESAVAHAGLSDSFSLLADYGLMHPREAMPRAEAAARTALALDPNSAEALSALAYVRSRFEWQWSEAETLYRRAIALNPGYSKSRHWFGVDLLAVLGRFDEAMSEIQIARDLDPLSLIIHEARPYLLVMSRSYDRAIDGFRHLATLDAGFHKAHSGIGRVLSLMGRYDEAIPYFEKALERAGEVPNIVSALGQTLALAGRREEALRCLANLHEMARSKYIPCTSFAILHMGLNELDQAVAWLEKSCELRELSLPTVKMHPVYDPLRGEPRFQNVLRKLGF